jgi:hypothetical protein
MDALNIEQVFYAYLFVEQNMKTPGTEQVTARIKYKSGNEIDWIDALEGCNNITQINLGKEKSEQNDCYDDGKYFCQKFRVHNFPDYAII